MRIFFELEKSSPKEITFERKIYEYLFILINLNGFLLILCTNILHEASATSISTAQNEGRKGCEHVCVTLKYHQKRRMKLIVNLHSFRVLPVRVLPVFMTTLELLCLALCLNTGSGCDA